MNHKIVCKECHWHGLMSECLKAAHPFMPRCELYGCPKCHEIETLLTACDEPDCWQEGTIGTPEITGKVGGRYRWTCCNHQPKGWPIRDATDAEKWPRTPETHP